MIKSYIRDEQEEWDENLSFLTAAYRSTPQESSHLTPNLIMLGRETSQPVDLLYGNPNSMDNVYSNVGEYVAALRDKLIRAHQVARKHLESAHLRQKYQYDINSKENMFNPGDAVWLLNETRKIGQNPKLQPTYLGPYIVLERLNNLVYKIQLDDKGQERIVNHDKLKKYLGDNYPAWGEQPMSEED
jgi:hypothetical protein